MQRTIVLSALALSIAACARDNGVGPGGTLEAPNNLTSVTLNGAVQLSWDDNARADRPDIFEHYDVYSTSYDLDNNVCNTNGWALEGTSVSEDFVVSGLTNGVSRCFAVSAVSTSGDESAASNYRNDTPRYDARNVLVSTAQSDLSTSGFRFEYPNSSTLGDIESGDRDDIDFRVDRHSNGTIWLSTVRDGTEVVLYSDSPVEDLTSIDYAPLNGYFTGSIQAVTGYAYVFQTELSDGLHYGAVRVTHVGSDYIILDWAYQTDYGNPELRRVR